MSIFVLLLHPDVPCQVHSLPSSDGQLDRALLGSAVWGCTPQVGLCGWDTFIAFRPLFPFYQGPERRAELSVRQSSWEPGMAWSYWE